MLRLDLRGFGCGMGVLETKKVLEGDTREEMEIMVDERSALENILRLLGTRDDILYNHVMLEGGNFTITVTRSR